MRVTETSLLARAARLPEGGITVRLARPLLPPSCSKKLNLAGNLLSFWIWIRAVTGFLRRSIPSGVTRVSPWHPMT